MLADCESTLTAIALGIPAVQGLGVCPRGRTIHHFLIALEDHRHIVGLRARVADIHASPGLEQLAQFAWIRALTTALLADPTAPLVARSTTRSAIPACTRGTTGPRASPTGTGRAPTAP